MIVSLSKLEETSFIDSMANIEAELFGADAWNSNMIREELHSYSRYYCASINPLAHNKTSLICGSDCELQGYAGIWFDGEDAQIMTIGVAQKFQHQGIGKLLLQYLIETTKKLGGKRMLLEVRVDNNPAIALYELFGFERMGLRKRYYQLEGIDAYTMSLQL